MQLSKNYCALSKETCTCQLKLKSLQKTWIWSKELWAGEDGGRVLLVGLQLPHGLALWKNLHFLGLPSSGKHKGHFTRVLGIAKALQQLSLLIP